MVVNQAKDEAKDALPKPAKRPEPLPPPHAPLPILIWTGQKTIFLFSFPNSLSSNPGTATFPPYVGCFFLPRSIFSLVSTRVALDRGRQTILELVGRSLSSFSVSSPLS